MFQQEFNQWAKDYFRADGPNVNRYIPCDEMFSAFRASCDNPKIHRVSVKEMKQYFFEFLALNGYYLNPQGIEGRTVDNRVLVHNINGRLTQCYYVMPYMGAKLIL